MLKNQVCLNHRTSGRALYDDQEVGPKQEMILRVLAPTQNIGQSRKRNPGGLGIGKGWLIAKLVLIGLLDEHQPDAVWPCWPGGVQACHTYTIESIQATQIQEIQKSNEQNATIDLWDFYTVSPVYCDYKYQFQISTPTSSYLTLIDLRFIQIDTQSIVPGEYQLTIKPLKIQGTQLIEDAVSLSIVVSDYNQDCSLAALQWIGKTSIKVYKQLEDTEYDLSSPACTIEGCFESSHSQCPVSNVEVIHQSGTGLLDFSKKSGAKVSIKANSQFKGIFEIEGQILDQVSQSVLFSLKQVVEVEVRHFEIVTLLQPGKKSILYGGQTEKLRIDTEMIKPVDLAFPFTNFRLFDTLTGAEQPAGIYEIQQEDGIEYLKLKADLPGSFNNVLGFDDAYGTLVKLTSVPFEQINCGFEKITKTEPSLIVLYQNALPLEKSLSDLFAVDSEDCGIQAFSLLNEDGSMLISDQISLEDQKLKVSTQNLIIQTVYIEAETKGGVKSQAMVSLAVTCGVVSKVVYISSATLLTVINSQTDDAVIKVTSSLDVSLCQITTQTLSVEDQAGTVIQDYSQIIEFTPQINGVTQAEIKILDKKTPRHFKFKITTSSGSVTLPQALVAEAIVEEAVVEVLAKAIVEEAIVEEAVVEEAVVAEEAIVKEVVVEEAVVQEAVVEEASVEESQVEARQIAPPKFIFDPQKLTVEVGKAYASMLPVIYYLGNEKVEIKIENQSQLPGFISLTRKEGGYVIEIKDTTIESEVSSYTVTYVLSAQEKGSVEVLKSTKDQKIEITKAENPKVDKEVGKIEEKTTIGGAQGEEKSEEDGKQVDEKGEGIGEDGEKEEDSEGTLDGEDSSKKEGETEIKEEEDYYDYYEEGDGAEEKDADEVDGGLSDPEAANGSKFEEEAETASGGSQAEAASTGSATGEATITGSKLAKAKLKEPSAEEIMENKMAEEEKKRKKQEQKRFKKSGFKKQKGVGYTFPGVDPKKVEAALKARKELRSKKNNKEEKVEIIPDPAMKVGALSSIGQIQLDFNQEMIYPETINFEIYKSIVQFSIVSDIDGSYTRGNIVKDHKSRELQVIEDEDFDAVTRNPLEFNITVEKHDAKTIVFQMHFQNPGQISQGNAADQLQIKIKGLSLFKSAKTLKVMQKSSFGDGNSIIQKSMPAMISEKEAKTLTSTTENGGLVFNLISQGNFLVSLILGGSMQQLWGMIRAMQVIVTEMLIEVPTPAHTFVFFQGCMKVAQLDIFDGATFYEKAFRFKETKPLNPKYELLDMQTKNFMLNSGSFLIIFVGIVLYEIIKFTANFIATKCPKNRRMRRIGMWGYSPSHKTDTKAALLKLFIESYFDLCFCTGLQMIAFHEKVNGVRQFWYFFGTSGDCLCSILALICTLFVLSGPVASYRFLKQKSDGKKDKRKYLKVLYKDNRTKNKWQTLFTFFFLSRRLVTVAVLVLCNIWPYCQTTLITISTTMFLIYLVTFKPLVTNQANKVEIFNETCILLFSYMMTTMLNIAIPFKLRETIGWVMIYIASFNIMGNLMVVARSSFKDLIRCLATYKAEKQVKQILKQKLTDRKNLVEIFGGRFEDLMSQLKMQKYNLLLRVWKKERQWLINNNIPLDDFEEEDFYQTYLKKLNLFKVQADIKLTKALENAAQRRAAEILRNYESNNAEHKALVDEYNKIKLEQQQKKVEKRKQFGKFQFKWKAVFKSTLEKIKEEPEENNECDEIQNKLEKSVKEDFKNTNLFAGFKERHQWDNRGVQKHFSEIGEMLKCMEEEDDDKKTVIEIMNRENNDYMVNQFSKITKKVYVEHVKQRTDLEYLNSSDLKLDSSDQSSDLEDQILSAIDNTGKRTLDNFCSGGCPLPIVHGGTNDYIQAALLIFLHSPSVIRFITSMPPQTNNLLTILKYVVFECYQTRPQFIRDKALTVDVSKYKHTFHKYLDTEKPNDVKKLLSLMIRIFQEEEEYQEGDPDSVITQAFVTEVRTRVLCLNNHEQQNNQKFKRFLNLKPDESASDHMKDRFKDKKCSVICTQCKQHRGIQETTLVSLPEMLIFNRKTFDEPNNAHQKLEHTLNLTSLMSMELRARYRKKVYKLSGVVSPSTSSLETSQYQSAFKRHGQDMWNLFRKEECKQVKSKTLLDKMKHIQLIVYTMEDK